VPDPLQSLQNRVNLGKHRESESWQIYRAAAVFFEIAGHNHQG